MAGYSLDNDGMEPSKRHFLISLIFYSLLLSENFTKTLVYEKQVV